MQGLLPILLGFSEDAAEICSVAIVLVIRTCQCAFLKKIKIYQMFER